MKLCNQVCSTSYLMSCSLTRKIKPNIQNHNSIQHGSRQGRFHVVGVSVLVPGDFCLLLPVIFPKGQVTGCLTANASWLFHLVKIDLFQIRHNWIDIAWINMVSLFILWEFLCTIRASMETTAWLRKKKFSLIFGLFSLIFLKNFQIIMPTYLPNSQ